MSAKSSSSELDPPSAELFYIFETCITMLSVRSQMSVKIMLLSELVVHILEKTDVGGKPARVRSLSLMELIFCKRLGRYCAEIVLDL